MKKGIMGICFAFGCVRPPVVIDGKTACDSGGAPTTDSADTIDTGDSADTDSGTIDTGLAEEQSSAFTLSGNAGSMSGAALAEGDIDGDLSDDLLVGAPGTSTGVGMAYLVPGPIAADAVIASAASVTFYGITDGDGFGTSFAHADFNSDGAHDIAVGAVGGGSAGYAVAMYAPFTSTTPASTALVLESGTPSDAFGAALAAGDVNADGIDDLVIGAPESGNVAVYAGSVNGIGAAAPITFTSEGAFGAALVVADVNADGIDDLVIGAPEADGDAAASGKLLVCQGMSAAASDAPEITGEAEGDLAGASIAAADVNSDGNVDLLIGASHNDRSGINAGTVYLVRGPITEARSLAEADAIIVGAQAGGEAGSSVAFAHDVDSDGVYDITVGAPRFDEDSMIDAGRAYIVSGPINGWMSLAEADYVKGTTEGGTLGAMVLGDTELSGDSIGDVLVAAPTSSGGMVGLVTGY